jgi:hypothetical protein
MWSDSETISHLSQKRSLVLDGYECKDPFSYHSDNIIRRMPCEVPLMMRYGTTLVQMWSLRRYCLADRTTDRPNCGPH